MNPASDLTWLDEIKWDSGGLVPAIAQDAGSGRILTLAWMNREALIQTVQQRKAIYWSRSRQRLWQKGEVSGHIQEVQDIYLDCDRDALLLTVQQHGGIACHTGRTSCFFHRLQNGHWHISEKVIKDPRSIYPGEDAP